MTKDSAAARELLSKFSTTKTQLLQLLLEKQSGQAEEIEQFPRDASSNGTLLPTSAAQQRMWLVDLEGGGAAYHIPIATRLLGTLDRAALQQALDSLVQRHETLRTIFLSMEGEPKQRVKPEGRFALQVVDLSAAEESEREMQIRTHMSQELHGRFDLSAGPLIRGRLLRIRAEEHVLLITLHHIIFDAWSMGIFVRELAELYAAYSEELENPLAPLSIQYADFAQWQRRWLGGEAASRQLDYWRDRLAGAAPQLDLPTDRPRPSTQSYRGQTVSMTLDAELRGELNAFALRRGMTLFMVSYAAWAILLSRLSSQDDVVIGTPVANRRIPGLERLIGFFINTLVLRVGISSDLRVDEFLNQIRKTTLEAYDNQDVPFERLVEVLHPHRDPGRNPLFQVMLVVQNAHENTVRLPGLIALSEEPMSTSAKFDLLLSMEERQNDEIVCKATYATDLFDRETVERWMDCFEVVLRGILQGQSYRTGELSILPDAQLRLLKAFNATQTDYSQDRLVHELFEQQARRTPDAVALMHGTQCLTYAELNARADRLAKYLRSRGVGAGGLVGICVERSLEMVVGLLGILKSGGAYLPLDPNYPPERLQHMLEDAVPQVLLTQHNLIALLPAATEAEVILLDANSAPYSISEGDEDSDVAVASTPEQLVYVIYTSGSTGRPKGTAMPHRSMINLIEWQCGDVGAAEGQRVLQFAALSFDVAFQEIFTTLCTGGTLVLLDEWVRKDTAALTELLIGSSIERLFVPPLMLQSLAEHARTIDFLPSRLSDVITAGEQLRISPEIIDLFKRLNGCRLHNHYGPTETHVVTALTLAGDPDVWPVLPSIGRPIANAQMHVLNESQRPVPVGAVGEIFIGGVGVARGYLGRPELTAQRFIADPFRNDSEARLYKTGDLGRWRSDGTIEYLGRNDDQVKIRGYRIELGEIETLLARHHHVKEAAVVAREDVPGEKRLVAYFTQFDQGNASIDELRTYLKGLLPDYMVPSAFVKLQSLPLTPSGKLDRRALPPPAPDAYASMQYQPPQGDVEEFVALIWKELLNLQRIGREDNFFDLGGHSLLAVKSLFRINQFFGTSLRVTELYRNPTLRDLAARIRGGNAEDKLLDLSQEATLDDRIVAAPGSPRVPAEAVLLTGGTGFVGRFLLAQLLQDTEATIYCLVRAQSEKEGLARIKTTLVKWGLWRNGFERRIVAIPGDLRRPRLGTSSVTYRLLAENIDSILHCATSMNHLETYEMAKPANVGAARDLLELATCRRAKLVNYVSTFGVFAPSSDHCNRLVDEGSSIDHETHWSSRGYVASKWVGEKIFMTASERGIPCNIFRVGLVWPDSEQGRYDELQHDYRILKSCLMSGFGIKNYRDEAAPTPVDYAARAMVFLANRHGSGQGVFHISSPKRKIEGVFERWNQVAGTTLHLKSFYDWMCEIRQLHYEGRSLPAVPLLEYAFSMDEEAFNAQQRNSRSARIRFDCSRTHQELERAGIVVSASDDHLLKISLESMLSRDPDLQQLSVGATQLKSRQRI